MVDSMMWSNKQVNLKDGLKEVHISSSLSANMHWIRKGHVAANPLGHIEDIASVCLQ